MKCLSLMQLYAWLVVTGRKTIELRTWNTHYRGKFLVHASKRTDKSALENLKINPDLMVNGAVIGSAFIYNVKKYGTNAELEKDYAFHFAHNYGNRTPVYGFMLKNHKTLKKPIKINGKLGFFEVDASIDSSIGKPNQRLL